MIDTRRAVCFAYYAVLLVLLAMAVTGTTGDVFPHQLAKHVSEDSEGWLLALLLPAWIQYARPRLTGRRAEWPLTLLAAAVMLVIGLVCYGKDGVPPKIATLNETFFALAVLLPYVQLRRPVSRGLAYGLPGAVLLVILVASTTSLVTNLAEGVVMLVLAPIGLDVVDRVILEPERRVLPARWAWYAFLVVEPLVVAALEHTFSGVAGDVVAYAARVQESFVGVLLVELYLAVVLLRVPRSDLAGAHPGR